MAMETFIVPQMVKKDWKKYWIKHTGDTSIGIIKLLAGLIYHVLHLRRNSNFQDEKNLFPRFISFTVIVNF